MAGVDGGIGGQQPIRRTDTGQVNRTGQVGHTEAPHSTDPGNLSVSHTEGQQQRKTRVHVAGIPAPDPGAVGYLATQNPNDLQALLANLNAETTQVHDEFAVSNAQANKADVQKAQKDRQAELEKLQQERAQAQKKGKCAKVKLAFANVFSLGIAGKTGFGKKMNAEYDKAMQKVAIIDLQINGLVSTPPPTLSPELREVVDTFNSHAPFEKLTNKPKKDTRAVIDRLHQENRIDGSTYAALNQLVNKHNTGDGKNGEIAFFKEVVLLQAQLDAGQAASVEALPEIPVSPDGLDGSPGTSTSSTAASESTFDDNAWLAEMAALMNAQEEEMNEVIAQLEQAQQAIVSSAQDGYDLASFRYTSV